MSFSNIDTQLESRLKALPGFDSNNIAWPNKNYNPVVGVMYLRVFNLRANNGLLTFDREQANTGVFQVDVVAPKNETEYYLRETAESIVAHYKTATLAGVEILSINLSPSFADDAWHSISVSIEYRSIF